MQTAAGRPGREPQAWMEDAASMCAHIPLPRQNRVRPSRPDRGAKAAATPLPHPGFGVLERLATACIVLGLLASFGTGCASTKRLKALESDYCSGNYVSAAESARTKLSGKKASGAQGRASDILDNLYAGSALFMAGDTAGAETAFGFASDGIDEQDASFFGMGYPTRTYDVSMAAGYRALALWAEGDTEAARRAFRQTADAQERADERNARAIRKAEDEAEKARASELSDARARASGNGESVDQVVSSLFKEASSGSGRRQVDSYLSEYSSWSVYGNFQMPSTWFLDGLFSLANAELPSDLEHASFAARKAYGMVPATPTKALFALAEARADGRLSRRKLDQVFAVVFENGLGPWIDERQFHIPVPYKGRVYTLSFALPKLVRRDAAYSKLVVRDGAVALGETSTVGELDRVAVREFKARMPSIVAAQMFSAAVKVGLQIAIVEAARRKGGDEAAAFTSYFTSLASVAATGTDTRHWNLLPKNVQAAMLRKPQTPDRAVELWVPGAAAPLAKVSLPETGLSVIYVKVPRPGLPPLVRILGDSQ